MKQLTVLGCFLLFVVAVCGDDLASEFTNSASLDEDSKVRLYWSVDWDEKTVHFAVQARTTGWVGFGISTGQGKMKGADIVIGWVKEGKTYFSVSWTKWLSCMEWFVDDIAISACLIHPPRILLPRRLLNWSLVATVCLSNTAPIYGAR